MIAILAVIADGGRAIVVIYREGVEINYFLLYFFDSAKTLQRRPRPTCEIIGDLVTYLVPHGILIQVSSYRTFVLPYIFIIGFKNPIREFSRFTRNLN